MLKTDHWRLLCLPGNIPGGQGKTQWKGFVPAAWPAEDTPAAAMQRQIMGLWDYGILGFLFDLQSICAWTGSDNQTVPARMQVLPGILTSFASHTAAAHDPCKYLSGLLGSLRVLTIQPGFGSLNVPVCKLSPEEVIQESASIPKVVPLMRCSTLLHNLESRSIRSAAVTCNASRGE